MSTLMEKTANNLVKKFHVLIGKAGIDQSEKMKRLAKYGVTSSTELDAHDLLDLCNELDEYIKSIDITKNKKVDDMDKWRKRVIAALCDYFDVMGVKYITSGEKIDKAKGMACKATQFDRFNDIPRQRLINLYNGTKKSNNDIRSLYSEMTDVLCFCEKDRSTQGNLGKNGGSVS